MARAANKLTDLAIRQAKPYPDGQKTRVLPDGYGLRLTVTPGGRKFWQYRTAVGGVERTAQIGEYPAMSLDAARQKAAELRELGRKGRNPVAEHQAAKLRNRISAETTFEAVANELLAGKKKSVSESHYVKISGALKANLYPTLGPLPIQEISPPMLREALRKLENRGALDYLAGGQALGRGGLRLRQGSRLFRRRQSGARSAQERIREAQGRPHEGAGLG
jgi:hypothetical protein